MARIDNVVEGVLKENPHLTRAEAIRFVTMQRDKIRSMKLSKNKKRQAQERRRKGKPPKGSIKTVSGELVSPK